MVQVVRVGDLAEQIRGVTFAKSDSVGEPAAGYLPVLRAGNIQEAGLDFTDLLYVPEARVRERQKLQKNDVVIAASSGSLEVVGKAARCLANFEGGFGAFCKVLRPNSKVDPAYFAHYFKTPAYRTKVSSLAEGANINNLKNEHLDDLLIRLPPLDEQRRIAVILDQVEELRAKRRRVLAHLDDLAQSQLALLLDGHENVRRELGKVANFFGGASLPPGVEYTGQEGGHLLMKVSDMNRAANQRDIVETASWSETPGPRAATCPAGSIVLPKRGGAIGTNKKRVTTRSTVLDPNLMAVVPGPDLDLGYLFAWFLRFDLTTISSGSSVPQLNKQDLAPLLVPVPPLSDQREFSARLFGLDLMRGTVARGLESLNELFVSLQSRAFRGEL